MSPEMTKKVVGAGAGIVIGLLVLWIGFFKTLLLAALAGLGWWLCGSREIPEWLSTFCANAVNWIKNAAEEIKNRFPRNK